MFRMSVDILRQRWKGCTVPAMSEHFDEDLIDIRKLYPHMTDEELREARDNLRRYVAVIVRIYDRLKAEGKEWPAPQELGSQPLGLS